MMRVLYLVAIVAAIVSGCTKEHPENPQAAEPSVTAKVMANLDSETRTYIGADGRVHWAASGEKLGIVYYADGRSVAREITSTHDNYTISDEGRVAFTADFTPTDGAVGYTFGAFYPYVNVHPTKTISIAIPQTQSPTAKSFDPKTDILVSVRPITTDELPDEISFTFTRMVAFAKMTIKGIGRGEIIERVTFSSSAKPIGSVGFNLHEAATLDNATWSNDYEDITIVRDNWVATGEDDVWMTTVPIDLSGTDFTVTVVTNRYIYTKSVDLEDRELNLKRGDVAQFSVGNLKRELKPVVYRLLKDVSELNAGDRVVIATKATATSSAHLLSTSAKGTSLGYSESLTISEGSEIYSTSLPDDAAVFDVEQGATAETVALKVSGFGYLYGSYNSSAMENTLSFKEEMDASSSWTITLDDNYVAYIGTFESEDSATMRYVNNDHYGAKFNFLKQPKQVYIYYHDGIDGD